MHSGNHRKRLDFWSTDAAAVHLIVADAMPTRPLYDGNGPCDRGDAAEGRRQVIIIIIIIRFRNNRVASWSNMMILPTYIILYAHNIITQCKQRWSICGVYHGLAACTAVHYNISTYIR